MDQFRLELMMEQTKFVKLLTE